MGREAAQPIIGLAPQATCWHGRVTSNVRHHKDSRLHIFFDTEFSQFRDGQLLSIGFVTEDDRHLYVELHDPDRWSSASEFCKNVVLPQFGILPALRVRTDREAGSHIANWIRSIGPSVTLAYDYKLDWRFFEGCVVASGDWNSLRATTKALDVADFANSQECLEAQERYLAGQSKPGRHHALVDAFALRQRWLEYQRRAA